MNRYVFLFFKCIRTSVVKFISSMSAKGASSSGLKKGTKLSSSWLLLLAQQVPFDTSFIELLGSDSSPQTAQFPLQISLEHPTLPVSRICINCPSNVFTVRQSSLLSLDNNSAPETLLSPPFWPLQINCQFHPLPFLHAG